MIVNVFLMTCLSIVCLIIGIKLLISAFIDK